VVDREIWSAVLLLLIHLMVNIAVLSALSPAPFFRYLAPIIPTLILLVAALIGAAARLHPAVAAVAICLWLLGGPMTSFLYEITHDYDGPIEGIVSYLSEHGTEEDLVVITYGDMPLKFYTGMRVLGGLTGEDLSPVRDADWVIIRRNIISDKDAAVHEYIARHLQRDAYQRVELDLPDIPFENREDPSQHLYRSVTDPRIEKVSIFRRVDH
jgi:hypothetical protein